MGKLFTGSGASGLTRRHAGLAGLRALRRRPAARRRPRSGPGGGRSATPPRSSPAVAIVLHGHHAARHQRDGGQGRGPAHGPWQDLGTGGWLLCIALFSIGAGGFVAARRAPVTAHERSGRRATDADAWIAGRLHEIGASTDHAEHRALRRRAGAVLPAHGDHASGSRRWSPTSACTCCWPSGSTWSSAGPACSTSGYIAFYAIGSYTTAYLTGSLPVKPPAWLTALAAVGDPVRDRDLPARRRRPRRSDAAAAR